MDRDEKDKRQEEILGMPDSRILEEARQHVEELFQMFDVLIRRHESMGEGIDILSHQVKVLRERFAKETD